MEMVRLFQLQLEHYEKVEGQALILEGKANQLSQMVRANLAMAMQGFVVVPLFAGYDLRRRTGRIYTYDPTGGRYEETDFHADGSGGRDARTTIKLGWREDMARADAIELAVQALYEAADEDSATGGPDAVRGIYPTVATITAAGFEAVPEAEVAERFAAVIAGQVREGPAPMSMPFYVAPEQFMKDKADFARKNIARGRPLVATVYADGILICAENPSKILHKVSEIYDRIAFAGVGRYNEFDQLRRAGRAARRRQGLPVQPGGRRRPVPGQPLRPVHRQRLHPRDEAARGRDPVAEVGRRAGGDQLFHILYDGTVVDEDRFSVLGGEAEAIAARMEEAFTSRLAPGRGAARRRPAPWPARTGPSPRRPRGGGAGPAPTAGGPSAASRTTRRPTLLAPSPTGPAAAEPRSTAPRPAAGRRSAELRTSPTEPAASAEDAGQTPPSRRSARCRSAASSWSPVRPSTSGRRRRRPTARPRRAGRTPPRPRRPAAARWAHSASSSADPHRHVADWVRAVDAAPQLGHDAVGAEPGGDHPGVEGVVHRPQVHHAGTGHVTTR